MVRTPELPPIVYPIQVTNDAAIRRRRWCDVALPYAEDHPAMMRTYPQGWLAVKGKNVGVHSTIYHVFGEFEPNSTTDAALIPTEETPPPFVASPWVSDDIAAVIPKVFINGQKGLTVFDSDSHDVNPACSAFRFRTVWTGGFVHLMELRTYSLQDVVEFRSNFHWSDPTSEALELENIDYLLKFGEEVHIDFARRLGVDVNEGATGGWIVNVHCDAIGDAEGMPIQGTILCRPIESAHATIDEEEHDLMLDDWREDTLQAEKSGPLRGIFTEWGRDDAPWLAFGINPGPPAASGPYNRSRWAFFLSFLDGSGDKWDERRLANRKATESTGDQMDFGSTKDALVIHRDLPYAGLIYELEYNSTYPYRNVHNFEADGSRVLAEDHPDCKTWNMRPDHRVGSDMLGKPWAWPPYELRHGVSGFSGADDQHGSQNYELALWALTGDWILEQSFIDVLQMDLLQVPGRMGAPRAVGRLMLRWAGMALLLEAKWRDVLLDHMVRKLDYTEAQWHGRRWTDDKTKAHWLGTVTDDRVIPDQEAAMVWQDSIGVIGLHAAAKVFARFGRMGASDRFSGIVYLAARTIMLYGVFEAGQPKRWHWCTGVVVNSDGSPQQEPYYQVGNPDILVSNGFMSWIMPAILIYAELETEDGPDLDRAHQIIRDVLPNGAGSVRDAEWFACAPIPTGAP